MPRYVTLYEFTQQGAQNLKESPERFRTALDQAESLGGKVISANYTEGPYDLVVVSEWDDEDTAAAFALTIAQQGNVKSTTMRAWTAEEFAGLVDRIP